MEDVAKLFSIAMPLFLVLVVSEKIYGYLKGKDTVPWMDAISSSYSGVTLIIRMLFGIGLTLVSYDILYRYFALFHIEATWLLYLVSFILMDFQFYWGHRLSHTVNILWSKHLIHHSSEEFNIACSMRQPALDLINFLFFIPILEALFGIPPLVIATVFPFHKLFQIWYHTKQIGKLGFLEYIIVTPTQHSVHHALNPIYIDKNYSAIFNIWDRIFGTFQEELESEPPVHGITNPSQTYNPITINFQHLILIIKDFWRAEKWMDKVTIWFRTTGWRPEGFDEKYPITKITDPHNIKKFNPYTSKELNIWSTIQFFTLFFIVIFVLFNIDLLGISGIIALTILVFVQTYSATELMNRNKWAPLFSVISTIMCFAIYLYDTSFFGFNRISYVLPYVFLIYFITQTFFAFTFSNRDEKLSELPQQIAAS